jgi:HlyD family secretion protein
MRRLVLWIVVLAVVFGGLAALSVPLGAWWKERSTPKYLTAKVTRGRVESVVNSTGTIKPVRIVSVGAFTSGPIKEVYVDFNTEITEKDYIVAIIDNRLQIAAMNRDKAAVDTQKADLERIIALHEQAERNEKRAIQLRGKSKEYISDTEMDQFKYTRITLEKQRNLAEAAVRQAEATLKNTEEQLGYTKVRGPKEIDTTDPDPAKHVKGRVIDRKVDPGQTVAASFQTPELFTIALEMDRHMFVFASVDEADIGNIRAGKDRKQKVTFYVDAYPGELFHGTIHEVRLNSTTQQNVVTYPVVIDAPNFYDERTGDLKLKPGMTANITFQIEAKENVLRVPTSALRYSPPKEQVHPEDHKYLEALTSAAIPTTGKRSANDKASMAKARHNRTVWVKEGPWLRAIPVTLGLMEHQFAELIKGDLAEDRALVIGVEGAFGPR